MKKFILNFLDYFAYGVSFLIICAALILVYPFVKLIEFVDDDFQP